MDKFNVTDSFFDDSFCLSPIIALDETELEVRPAVELERTSHLPAAQYVSFPDLPMMSFDPSIELQSFENQVPESRHRMAEAESGTSGNHGLDKVRTTGSTRRPRAPRMYEH